VPKRLRSLTVGAWKGGIALGITVAGLVFPLDFFTQVESLRLSFSAFQILGVFSFAWALYFVLSATAGALIVGGAAAVLMLCRRYDERILHFLIQSLIAVVLVKALIGVVITTGSLVGGSFRLPLIVTRLVEIGLAAWLVWRNQALLDSVRGFLTAVTVCGAVSLGVTILTAAMPWGQAANEPLRSSGPRPPLILITIDTLSASHMSLYGHFRDTTPSLKKFASESFVFEHHYSNANFTTPSISSILTGTRPWVHRTFQLNSRPLRVIAQAGLIPTLKRAGYRILAVATNPYANPRLQGVDPWVDSERPGKIEFPEYRLVNLFPTFGSVLYFPTLDRLNRGYRQFAYRHYTSNLHNDPEVAFAEARSMLTTARNQPEPVFLWVHLFGAHDPYAAPRPFLQSFNSSSKALTVNSTTPPYMFEAPKDPNFPGVLSDRYDEAVRYMDDHVGRFLDWLRPAGLLDDALVIVTADHGESFGHSYGGHTGPMLYEELIHVPLLVKLPHQHSGSRIPEPRTAHADLLPTILDYMDLPVPAQVEGRSFLPVLEGRTLPQRPVFAMNFEKNSVFGPLRTGSVAVLEGRYKYVRHLGALSYPLMPKIEESLYDLETDPAEERNLASQMPGLAARMGAQIKAEVALHSLPIGSN
jgi:arylsulfatase A-like enzyme